MKAEINGSKIWKNINGVSTNKSKNNQIIINDI